MHLGTDGLKTAPAGQSWHYRNLKSILNNNMNKTVAFLDVLGFRGMIKSTSLSELVRKYEFMVDSTAALNRPMFPEKELPTLFPNQTENEPWCNRYIFSDSIILISLNDDDISCLKLLVYAWRFTQALLVSGMPVRGAITHGEVYENPSKNIVLGLALTKAYELEQKQQWIGVAIDSSTELGNPELFKSIRSEKQIMSNVFLRYPVPYKDGTTEELHTLNWRFNLFVEKGTRSLFTTSNENHIIEKVQNTLKYAKTVIDLGKVYVQDQSLLPVELRSFFSGSKNPPFTHGDDL